MKSYQLYKLTLLTNPRITKLSFQETVDEQTQQYVRIACLTCRCGKDQRIKVETCLAVFGDAKLLASAEVLASGV